MILHRRAVASNWRSRLTRVAWVVPAAVLCAFVTRDQQYSLAKSPLGLCCGRAHLTSPALNAVSGQVFQRKLGSRTRTCASGHVAAPDPPRPLGGVSVPSLLRGPDSIWGPEPAGVRDSLGGPGAQPFWLRATSSGLRGITGPSPSGERVRGPSCRESRAQDHRGPAARPSGRS